MLKIFYGAAGTGKSAAIMDEIRRSEGSGVRCVLLVPEQYSHEAERELCSVCGDGLSLYAEVLSFTGLAREVSAECGGTAAEYLDKGGRLLCMALAADGLYSRLRVYGAARHKAELQTMLISAVDELKSACVTSGQLLAAADNCEGALGDKLHDLGLILEAYDGVVANGRADPSDRLSVLAGQIERSSIGAGTRVFVDGFTDFTAQERRVLEAIMLSGAELCVCLSCDELNGGSEVFALGRITAAELLRFASDNGIETKKTRWTGESTKRRPLSYFAENMFSYRAVEKADADGCIKIITAPDMNAECELAASEALRLVRDCGCRWRDIAVCAKGFDDYRLLLESAFSRYGAPVYTARKADMLSKPLPALISAAYEIILGGWEADDVFEYLRTGFGGLSIDECDELENYVFTWQIHGSAWTRPEPWTLHPDGYGKEFDERSTSALEHINLLRETARAPLMRFAERANNASTASEQAQALAALFDELGLAEKLQARADELEGEGRAAEASECARLWDITVTALEQCAAILGDTQAAAEYFGRLFALMLSRYDIGTIPVSLDCVTAGEMDRMRRRNIKHLIVLGATDERIPGTDNDAGVFSSDERKRLLELDIDLGGTGDSEIWRAFSTVYNCLTLPSESLTFCYALSGAGGNAQRSAFVVNRAKAMFDIDAKPFDADNARLSAHAPALELAAQSLHGGGTAAASAAEYFAQAEPERLRALELAASLSRGKLSRASVRALYGERLRLSASRIDKFASCRFAYFMQYALKAKPHEPADFTAPELGTFMHRILEQVTREVSSMGGYKSVDDETVRTLCDKYVSEYIKRELNDFRDKSKRFEYLFRRLISSVHQIVLDLADELRRSDFEPLSFELDFAHTPELPPLELGTGEDKLILTGIADRVDGWLHEGKLYLRIVDYKTGRKKFELSDVLYGMNLQMLLYLFSLGENGQTLYGHEIVPAGVLYVPARDEVTKSDFDLSDEELGKKRAAALRRSGLILNEPEVIAAMENSDTPQYIPVTFKKSGVDGDALVSAERLGVLARHIDKTLCEMASELRGGSIAADPYYAGQQETACINCDYFDACRFRDGENGESMRITPHLPATKVWSVLEGGETDGEI